MYSETSLIESLRQAGLRLTPQRSAICHLLADNDTHPSAQILFEQLRPTYPSLSLTTVYNTWKPWKAWGQSTILAPM
ncbi:MAG: transcriptional repressor [Anaerolineae bacterium]|nr:transcriptional repressor [Anaerolineae bacterium]